MDFQWMGDGIDKMLDADLGSALVVIIFLWTIIVLVTVFKRQNGGSNKEDNQPTQVNETLELAQAINNVSQTVLIVEASRKEIELERQKAEQQRQEYQERMASHLDQQQKQMQQMTLAIKEMVDNARSIQSSVTQLVTNHGILNTKVNKMDDTIGSLADSLTLFATSLDNVVKQISTLTDAQSRHDTDVREELKEQATAIVDRIQALHDLLEPFVASISSETPPPETRPTNTTDATPSGG